MKIEERIGKIESELEKIKKEIKSEIKWTKVGDLFFSDNLGEMSWSGAMAKAKELGARLPERWEMIKVVDENYDEMQELVKDDPSNVFWTATEVSATSAWSVTLNIGYTVYSNKTTTANQVRCVR